MGKYNLEHHIEDKGIKHRIRKGGWKYGAGKGWKYNEGAKHEASHNNGNGKKGHKKGGYRAWLHTRHKIRKSLVR